MVGLDAEGGVAGAAVEPRRVSGGVKYLDSSISRCTSWIVDCFMEEASNGQGSLMEDWSDRSGCPMKGAVSWTELSDRRNLLLEEGFHRLQRCFGCCVDDGDAAMPYGYR